MAAIGRRETSENRRGKMRCRLSGKALGKSSDEVELESSDDLTMNNDRYKNDKLIFSPLQFLPSVLKMNQIVKFKTKECTPKLTEILLE